MSNEPAHSIIVDLGGVHAVSRICGVHRVTVSKWKRDRARGGTGGWIPFQHQPAIISAATAQGVTLRPEDFLPKQTLAPAAQIIAGLEPTGAAE